MSYKINNMFKQCNECKFKNRNYICNPYSCPKIINYISKSPSGKILRPYQIKQEVLDESRNKQ